MKLTEGETITLRAAINALEAAEEAICAANCEACPLNDADVDDCILSPVFRRLNQIIENYGTEEGA